MKKDSIGKSLGVISLYFLLNILISILFVTLDINNDFLKNILLIIENIGLTMFIVYLLRSKLENQFKNFKKNYPKYIKIAIKYWLLGFLLMMISNAIINSLSIGGIAPNEAANREILTTNPISIFIICLLGPFTEELLFRLNFRGVFKKRLSYILFTGISFGAMHIIGFNITLINLLYIIPYSILGIAFSRIFYDTDNVYASTFAHMLNNTLTVLVIFLAL